MANDHAAGTAVFPAGMTLRLDADGAVVGNQGDVVIEGDISKSLGKIKQVFSEQGSVVVSAPKFRAGSIEAAAGEVRLSGTVKARRITGASVIATGGKLTSKVVIADSTIELAGSSIKVELVVAPQVSFGPDTRGRATAVECDNEIGASKVRGRLNLEDYVDIVAGAREVLEANGIAVPEPDEDEEDDEDESLGGGAALGGAAEPQELSGAPPDEDLADDLEADSDDSDDEESEDVDEATGQPIGADLPSMEMGAPSGEDDESAGLSSTELSEFAEHLETALARIDEAYDGSDLPPPVVFLESLVAERRFETIKTQINSIWSDLLKYHQKKGLYISNAVTHQFQQIQIAMRRLPDA